MYEVAVVTTSFRWLPWSIALNNSTSWLCLSHPKILQSTCSHRKLYESNCRAELEILSLLLFHCIPHAPNADRCLFPCVLPTRNLGKPIYEGLICLLVFPCLCKPRSKPNWFYYHISCRMLPWADKSLALLKEYRLRNLGCRFGVYPCWPLGIKPKGSCFIRPFFVVCFSLMLLPLIGIFAAPRA